MTRKGEPLAWLSSHVAHASDECLEWPFGIKSGGYGVIYSNGRITGAYRVMCQMAHGAPPARAEAAHSCGNRKCVNPRHLRWATRRENHADMAGHGTLVAGERNPHAKLTRDNVLDILDGLRRGASRDALASQFGIRPRTVYDIETGRRWGWLRAA